MENLQEALDKVCYEDSSKFNEQQLLNEVKKLMRPCYDIECWDCDEYNTSLTANVVDWIADKVKEGYNNIQYAEWCTDSCDVYFCFVAVTKD